MRPHRVPADHATSEVLVRALHARVHDVHAHARAPARQVAVVVRVVIDTVDAVKAPRRARVGGQRDLEAVILNGLDDRVHLHERNGLRCGVHVGP